MSSPSVAKDTVVTMQYVLKDEGGEVLDSSSEGAPLSYLHGHENIVPGLEAALTGLTPGESKDVVVSAEEGYGQRDSDMVLKVARTQLPDDLTPEVGMTLGMETNQGHTVPVRIAEVTEDHVVLDANHELAGVTLHFSVTIESVRPATEEELSHGHVHGEGGHAH